MTKRDLFILIIKLWGLYSIVLLVFNTMPSILQVMPYGVDVYLIIYMVIAFVVSTILLAVLLFKAPKIVDLLKLDKGFEEENINFGDIKSITIIRIIVIFMGGSLVLYHFPSFLLNTYYIFKSLIVESQGQIDYLDFAMPLQVDYYSWILGIINIFIGYLLITNSERISKWLDKKQVKELDVD